MNAPVRGRAKEAVTEEEEAAILDWLREHNSWWGDTVAKTIRRLIIAEKDRVSVRLKESDKVELYKWLEHSNNIKKDMRRGIGKLLNAQTGGRNEFDADIGI